MEAEEQGAQGRGEQQIQKVARQVVQQALEAHGAGEGLEEGSGWQQHGVRLLPSGCDFWRHRSGGPERRPPPWRMAPTYEVQCLQLNCLLGACLVCYVLGVYFSINSILLVYVYT